MRFVKRSGCWRRTQVLWLNRAALWPWRVFFFIATNCRRQKLTSPSSAEEISIRRCWRRSNEDRLGVVAPADYSERGALTYRRSATTDHTASTRPNGHAPCRKPYTEPRAQATAKARMSQRLRASKA